MQNSTSASKQLSSAFLFYDGQCSLCAKEMRWLERLKSDGLTLVDIHNPRIFFEKKDLDNNFFESIFLESHFSASFFSNKTFSDEDKQRLLRRLHLLDANGHWRVGVDASVTAWSFSPLGFIARPLRWAWIAPWADRAYQGWADKRYCNKYSCRPISLVQASSKKVER